MGKMHGKDESTERKKRFKKEKNAFECVFLCVLILASVAAANGGSFIWDEKEIRNETFVLNPQIFPGFYYGFNSDSRDLFSETLEMDINASSGIIGAKKAQYKSVQKEIPFACEEFGLYAFMAWMGKPYIAAYMPDNGNIFKKSDETRFFEKGMLFPIKMDMKNSKKIGINDTYLLEDGYEISFSKDTENTPTDIVLKKDGVEVNRQPKTKFYVYRENLRNIGSVPLILISLTFENSDTVMVNGVFQISDAPYYFREEEYEGFLKKINVDKNSITLSNPEEIKIHRETSITLTDRIAMNVFDQNRTCFEMSGKDFVRCVNTQNNSKPIRFEKAGEIYDPYNRVEEWSGKNFNALTYDVQNGRTAETLLCKISENRREIEKGNVDYTTKTFPKAFALKEWGKYNSISIAGEEFFAGYIGTSDTGDKNATLFSKNDINLIKEGFITRIALNKNKKECFETGQKMELKEEYTLQLNDIKTDEKDTVCVLELKRNNVSVSRQTVKSGENFVYNRSYGNVTIPAIVIHVDSVFEGKKGNAVTTSGMFQLSELCVETKPGTVLDQLKIDGISRNEIRFKNKETLRLTKNTSVPLIGSLYFYVGDSENLVMFPYGGKGGLKTEKKLVEILIDIKEPLISGKETTIKVLNKATGKSVSGLTVSVDTTILGTTKEDGIKYTPSDRSLIKIEATGDGYITTAGMFNVLGLDKVLEVSFPDLIFAGDQVTVCVKNGLGYPVEDVDVFLENSKYEGKTIHLKTDSNGSVTFDAHDAADYTVKFSKKDCPEVHRNFKVMEKAPYFVIENVDIPLLYADSNNKITVTTKNIGRLPGNILLNMTIGNETKEKNVSLKPNYTKKSDFYFKLKEGTYRLSIENFTKTIEVLPKRSLWEQLGFQTPNENKKNTTENETNGNETKISLTADKNNSKYQNSVDPKARTPEQKNTGFKEEPKVAIALTVTLLLFLSLFSAVFRVMKMSNKTNLIKNRKTDYFGGYKTGQYKIHQSRRNTNSTYGNGQKRNEGEKQSLIIKIFGKK